MRGSSLQAAALKARPHTPNSCARGIALIVVIVFTDQQDTCSGTVARGTSSAGASRRFAFGLGCSGSGSTRLLVFCLAARARERWRVHGSELVDAGSESCWLPTARTPNVACCH